MGIVHYYAQCLFFYLSFNYGREGRDRIELGASANNLGPPLASFRGSVVAEAVLVRGYKHLASGLMKQRPPQFGTGALPCRPIVLV